MPMIDAYCGASDGTTVTTALSRHVSRNAVHHSQCKDMDILIVRGFAVGEIVRCVTTWKPRLLSLQLYWLSPLARADPLILISGAQRRDLDIKCKSSFHHHHFTPHCHISNVTTCFLCMVSKVSGRCVTGWIYITKTAITVMHHYMLR